MKLDKVTITGADNSVDSDDLIWLSELYPFVEWGILISQNRMGKDRYPTTQWIKSFMDKADIIGVPVNISGHLCGRLMRNLIANDSDMDMCEALDLLPEPVMYFPRIQWNFHDRVNPNISAHKLATCIRGWGNGIIPISEDPRTQEILHAVEALHAPVSALYDCSGGRGISPESWPSPIKGIPTGYAGGLGPHNIEVEMKRISEVSGDNSIWIDMEGNVRTDDKLDLDKVKFVLEHCKQYVESS